MSFVRMVKTESQRVAFNRLEDSATFFRTGQVRKYILNKTTRNLGPFRAESSSAKPVF